MFYHTLELLSQLRGGNQTWMWTLGDRLRILTITRGLRNYYILHDTTNNKGKNINCLLFLSLPLSVFTPALINFTQA